jgi:hypothetical protein
MAASPMELAEKPAPAHRTQTTLRGTAWTLQAVQAPEGSNPDQSTRPATGTAASHRQRATQWQQRLQSPAGWLPTGWRPTALLPLVSTKMACTADVIAFEQQYLKALEQVRQWNIYKR